MAPNLLIPDRHFQTERDRLSVHAVRAPDHHSLAMAAGELAQNGVEVREIVVEDRGRFLQHHGERRIKDIGRGETLVEVSALWPHCLGHRVDERQHVVLGGPFQLLDPSDVDASSCPDTRGGFARDHALLGHGVARQQLDLQPSLVLVRGRPQRRHGREAVPIDHARLQGSTPMVRNRCSSCFGGVLLGSTNTRSMAGSRAPSHQAFIKVRAAMASSSLQDSAPSNSTAAVLTWSPPSKAGRLSAT